jgi:hypothetical protein
MKKTYLVLVILFFFQNSYSQDEYEYGFIIDNKADTTWGMIRDRKSFPVNLYKRIRFIDQEGKRKRYGPDRIRAYQKGSGFYESRFYDDEHTFLKVIIKGYLSYYRREYEASGDDGSGIDSYALLLKSGEYEYFSINGLWYKRKMSAYLNDCPDCVDKLQNREFRFRNLYELVLYYNDNR